MILRENIKTIHLIGVCGAGMASLAAMLKERGYEVTGSDEAVYPPMSTFLEEKGIRILPRYAVGNLAPEPDLVVVGNALSRGNPEIEYVLNYRLAYTSFPEALKMFFLRDRIPIVVTGTHGKTTTTSMIAWGLHFAGRKPNFLVGGLAENFQSSFGLEGGELFVVEGDEYDSAFFDKASKFLHYLPQSAVVGNVEFDHADVFADLEAVQVQFRRFVNLLPERGYLAIGSDSPAALSVCRNALCRRETFGSAPESTWGVRDIRHEHGRLCFDVLYQKKLFRRLSLGILGAFNVRNALAATAILHQHGVPEDDIRDALESFRGVRRRLQFLKEVGGITLFEDFAHHPTAVRETLRAIRDRYQPGRLWAIYEPRSATSRRSIFQSEIAEALAVADLIALPDLFKPEKIPEGERLDLGKLIEDLRRAGRLAWNPGTVEGIIERVCEEARGGDFIVILSNGGFGGICQKLPEALASR